MLKQEEIDKALFSRFPEPVCLVVTKDKTGRIDLCPIGFFSLVAWEPKIWAIAIYEEHYTAEIISETKEFVLCLPAVNQLRDVLYCGSVHGDEVDKTRNISLKFLASKTIQPPLIDESIACFECQLRKRIKIADHFLFLGGVTAAHVGDKNWEQKIYNWDDKRLGNIKLGDTSDSISYSPEGEDE